MELEPNAGGRRGLRDVRIKDERLARVLAGEERLLFDGAMGTMLQRAGLVVGEQPEMLCVENPDAITAIHRGYVDAGSQAITTNTFGANREKLGDVATVEAVFCAAVKCARDAGACYVAADMGPSGELMEPLGDMTYEQAYELYAEQARAADAAGADLIIIETMTSLDELKAAVCAAQDHSELPVFATMTFAANGHTFMGATPSDEIELLQELEIDALGINCSLGPKELEPLVREMLENATVPVIMQANAGLPKMVGGETVYTITPEEYAAAVAPLIEAGVKIVGGCCGTDPTFIEALAAVMR